MKVDGEEGRKKEDREGGRRCIYRERNREKGNKGWVELAKREREKGVEGVWDEGREIESSPRPSLTTPLSAAWPLCQASCTKRRFLAAIAGATVYVYMYIYIYIYIYILQGGRIKQIIGR